MNTRIRNAQFEYIQEHLPVTTAVNLLAVGFTAINAWLLSSSAIPLIWGAVVFLASFLRTIIFRRIDARMDAIKKQRRMGAAIIVMMTIAGSIWALAALLFLQQPQTEEFVFTTLTIAGVTCVALPTTASYLPGFFGFALPPLLALIYQYLRFELYNTTALLVLFLVALILIGFKVNKIIMSVITLNLKNDELIQKVTESRNEAQKANIEKSNFLAAASHDLRQPLQALGFLLESLDSRVSGADGAPKKILGQALTSHATLSTLFNSLMELSQLDSGSIHADVKNICLNELLSALVAEFDVSAKQKSLTIIRSWTPCSIKADPILLNRIIRNLMSNAVKFTTHGNITVSTLITEKDVTLSIADTGIGIPEADLNQIFQEYHQLNNSERDQAQGIGLGLSVVDKMARIMGLKIKVKSQLGVGSTFSLCLPKGEEITQPDLVPVVKTEELFHHKILLIDDELNVLAAMTLMLEDWGCAVSSYQGLEEALEQLKLNQSAPDLIITDYRLKNKTTGLDAINCIQQQIGKPIPALLISGDTNPELVAHLRKQHYHILHKPVKPARLRKTMQQLLKPHHLA